MLRAVTVACVLAAAFTPQPQAPEKPIVDDYERYSVSALPPELGYDAAFYKKYVDAVGIPIIASAKVPDQALLIARDVVTYMVSARSDIRREMVARKFRVGVMATSESTTDIPEQRDWKKPGPNDPRLTRGEKANYDKPGGIASMTDKEYWDRRARGMGGPYTTCAEENILGYPGTRYYGENILVHEFSHGIMSALRSVDAPLYAEIQDAYEAAMADGRFDGHYAETTAGEYWAEGTQWWFWSNYEWTDAKRKTRLQTPDDLKAYDPALYAILERVYPGHRIPADVYYAKNISPRRRQ
jgi:hypothetical protein